MPARAMLAMALYAEFGGRKPFEDEGLKGQGSPPHEGVGSLFPAGDGPPSTIVKTLMSNS